MEPVLSSGEETRPRILTTNQTSKLRFTGASVATKLASVIGLATLVLIGVLAFISYRDLRASAVDQVAEGLLAVTRTVAPLIAVDDHLAVARGAGEKSAAFKNMRRILEQAANANELRYDQLYTFSLNDDGSLRFVTMLHDEPFIGQNYHLPTEIAPLVEAAIRSARGHRFGIIEDAHGEFISAFAPIVSASGETVGLVWADRDVTEVLNSVRTRVMTAVAAEFFVAFGLIAVVLWLASGLRRRLRVIVGGMRALRKGDEAIELEVKGDDELAEVASAFNALSRSVHERRELARYVPEHARQYVQELVRGRLHRKDAQRRVSAVIVFTDVRGFTEFSERLSPEDVVSVANAVLARQSEVVRQHGGRVDKFLGDGILAVFEGERQAERALRAGGEIQLGSRRLSLPALEGESLEIGIGMTFGEVIEGTIGTDLYRERAVLGAQVNLASRLCAHSLQGQLIVSGALFEQVRGRIPHAKSRVLQLKGIEHIHVYSIPASAALRAFDPDSPLLADNNVVELNPPVLST